MITKSNGNSPCKQELIVIEQVLSQLQNDKKAALEAERIASMSNDNNLITYWKKQQTIISSQILVLQNRRGQTIAKCRAMASSKYSSYTQEEMNQAYDDCVNNNTDANDVVACYDALDAKFSTTDNITTTTSDNTNTNNSSGGGFMKTVEEVFNFAKDILGKNKTSTTTASPTNNTPPPSNKLVLGMTPALGVGVIILTSAAAIWGIVALVKYANKPVKVAAPAK